MLKEKKVAKTIVRQKHIIADPEGDKKWHKIIPYEFLCKKCGKVKLVGTIGIPTKCPKCGSHVPRQEWDKLKTRYIKFAGGKVVSDLLKIADKVIGRQYVNGEKYVIQFQGEQSKCMDLFWGIKNRIKVDINESESFFKEIDNNTFIGILYTTLSRPDFISWISKFKDMKKYSNVKLKVIRECLVEVR